MPKKVLPRIEAVSPGDDPMTLRVRWREGDESVIDISGMIENFKVYAPLRKSPELFRQVRVGEYGTDIVWTDEIDMSVDTLWRLAQEQSGETMTAAEFRNWRKNSAYTLDSVAKVLGISRRTVAYYERGNRVIPRVVMLATRGLDNLGSSRAKGAIGDLVPAAGISVVVPVAETKVVPATKLARSSRGKLVDFVSVGTVKAGKTIKIGDTTAIIMEPEGTAQDWANLGQWVRLSDVVKKPHPGRWSTRRHPVREAERPSRHTR